MSLAAPLMLLALLSLPVLWILARARRNRREERVASLLIWRRIGLAPDPPRETARRADRLLALRLAAAALLSFALAGPRIDGAPAATALHVLLDESPSMGAFQERADEAMAAVRDTGAELRVHRSPGLNDLPSALAAAGDGSVVAVTDHRPDGLPGDGRVRLLLVGEPVENVGIVSAWMEDGFGVVVRSFAAAERTVTVRHPGGATEVVLAPGQAEKVTGPAPEGRASIRLEPGDRFAFDDRVDMTRDPGAEVRLRWVGPDQPETRDALAASGVRFDDEAASRLCYRTAPDETARLTLAAPGERRAVQGAPAGGEDLAPEAVPDPGTVLGPTTVSIPAGRPLLSDGEGPLAVLTSRSVAVGLDPADAASTWRYQASFPIFMSEVARLLGARPPATLVLHGFVDPVESSTRPVGAPFDLTDLHTTPEGPHAEETNLAPAFYLLAAALLLLHLILEPRFLP